LISLTENFAVSMSFESDLLSYLADISCHRFLVVFTFVGGERGVVGMMGL
jgi:hypothetical protein